MRSSKPRSRKNNRNRPQSGGNIPNRVFDSSGPEGKVRGTPQQIIDKYQQLARDAQLSGDRVATENFFQHAEHYLRLLGAAQKEIDAKREQQEQENRERQAERDRERAERDRERAERDREREAQRAEQQERNAQNGQNDGGQNGGGQDGQTRSDKQSASNEVRGTEPQPDLLDPRGADAQSGLVETPETAPEAKTADAGEKPAPKPRKPRAPRKPRKKPEAKGDTDAAPQVKEAEKAEAKVEAPPQDAAE